ncbi:MAG: peptidoglycan-binding domain-containing protein [Thermodesulfobacteriota bacterium]|nr:peptidoglycan-binding domain-containing protein [Thermodesulfobacteriota bacterium]
MRKGKFYDLAELTFRETGYRLIILERLNDNLRRRHNIIKLVQSENGKESYLLFWKPPLKIDQFYYGYQGEEIKRLQKLLQDAGFYQHEPDGEVGKITMQSIVRYQKMKGLPVTGYPDERLLLYLYSEEAHSANG